MEKELILKDTPDQYQLMMDNYASILEKTNNQLGLWNNLSSISVTILSVLIAIIAIFVAFALWKNSKDQKNKAEKFFSEQRKIIRENNKKFKLIESKSDKLINEYKKKLESIDKKDKKSRAEIQKTIDDLRREKLSAETYLAMPSSEVSVGNLWENNLYSSSKKEMTCCKCGKSFEYYDKGGLGYDGRTVLGASALLYGEKNVHCPHCGELNIAQ